MALATVKDVLARAMTDKGFRIKLLDVSKGKEVLKPYEKYLTPTEKTCLVELTPEKLAEFSTKAKIMSIADIRI